VHEEELNVLGVVDEESLMTRGCQVAGLLVATITDLITPIRKYPNQSLHESLQTYRGHGNGALESSADTVVDTLGLAP
jgi:hypothetical protein